MTLWDLGEIVEWPVGNSLLLRPGPLSSSWWSDLLTCHWYKVLWDVSSLRKVPEWLFLKGSFLLFLSLPRPYYQDFLVDTDLLIQCLDLWISFSRPVAKAGVTHLDAFGGPVGNVKEQNGSRIIESMGLWTREGILFSFVWLLVSENAQTSVQIFV